MKRSPVERRSTAATGAASGSRSPHAGSAPTCIVVAVDFTRSSTRAARRVALLRLPPGSQVHLLHAVPALPRGGSWETARRLEARGALKRLVARLRRLGAEAPPGLQVRAALRYGPAAEVIVRYARSMNADLVVLGRHGNRLVRRLLIGSTAERVARHCDAPVLVVHREPRAEYRRPLVAMADAPEAHAALRMASLLSDTSSRGVEVVRAVMPVDTLGLHRAGASATDVRRYRKRDLRAASLYLRRCLAPHTPEGIRMRPSVHFGDPRFVVLEIAIRRDADLVAVGAHERGKRGRGGLGAVAEHLLRYAQSDVLVGRLPGDH